MSTRRPPSTRQSESACSSSGELGRDRRRDVAELERPLLVPDPDRVRIVLVLRLGDEREPPTRIERRVFERIHPVGDARYRDDPDPRILPAHGLAGGGVAKVEPARAPLEPEPKPLAHCAA